MSDHTIRLELASDNRHLLEELHHQIRKEASKADRYGEQVSVRRLKEEAEHTEGFDEES
jgi:hypothetical protein